MVERNGAQARSAHAVPEPEDRRRRTRVSVRMAAPALAAVYGLLVPVHVVMLDGYAQHVMVVLAALTAMLNLALWRRIATASSRAATGMLTALCLAPMTNNVVHLAVEGRLEQTAMLMLTLVGVGAVCKSRLHAAILFLVGSLAWVVVVALTRPEPMEQVPQYAVELALACLLGIGVFLVRRAVSARLVLAHDALAAQLAQLDELGAVSELRLRRFRGVFDNSPTGIALADESGAIVEANPAMCGILGRPLADVVGSASADFTHPEDRARLSSLGELVASAADGIARVDGRYLRPDGSVRWAGLTVRRVPGPEGQSWTLAHVQDVTGRKLAEGHGPHVARDAPGRGGDRPGDAAGVDPRPAVLSSLLQLTTASSASMIERLDEQHVVVSAHFGRGSEEVARSRWTSHRPPRTCGAPASRCSPPGPANTHCVCPAAAGPGRQHALAAGRAVRIGARRARAGVARPRGRGFRAGATGVEAVATEAGAALLAESMRHDLEATTVTDALTGLLNRRGWNRELEGAVRLARRTGRPFTVALVDLDHFKKFNDTYGHLEGDRMLAEFAAYARSVLRDVDVVARWGGEEFSVMLRDTDQESAYEVLEGRIAGP